MKYIPIDTEAVPYKFELSISGETYKFYIDYNYLYDFFTVDLEKDEEKIIIGEKLIYGKPLFLSARYKDIPKITILPYDLSERIERITFNNLNKEVFLFLVGDDDEILD